MAQRATSIISDLSVRLTGAADAAAFAVRCAPVLLGSNAADCAVTTLSGGWTNQLYRVAGAGGSVVVRVFGESTECLIDRSAERFWQSCFLGTFGRCANALVCEFLEGFAPLTIDRRGEFPVAIVREIAWYHTVALQWGAQVPSYGTGAPHQAKAVMLGRWAELAVEHKDAVAIPGIDAEAMAAEARWLRAVLECLRDRLPEGPCHNDLNFLNVMRHDATGELRFIDFEYGGRNCFYYDIANFLQEFAGYDGEWSAVPSFAATRDLCAAYLDQSRTFAAAVARGKPVRSPSVAPTDPCPLSDLIPTPPLDEVAALVGFLGLVSHLGWALWGVVELGLGNPVEQYGPYTLMRWVRYKDTRDSLIATLKEHVTVDITEPPQLA